MQTAQTNDSGHVAGGKTDSAVAFQSAKQEGSEPFQKLTLRDGSSGLTIFAELDKPYNCVEFTTKANAEQPIFISPWMQFEPLALMEARSRIGMEIIRRTMAYDSLVKQIAHEQYIVESFRLGADRRDQEKEEILVVTRGLANALKRMLNAFHEDPFENNTSSAVEEAYEALAKAGA